ncbi:MAG: DNA-processing protein DprA [Bacteroidales bacterium]|nr:MAG: DNA-processing protein DprA [Bacteroidales bacterium]
MVDENLICKIGISLIPGIGSITAKKLIDFTGSIEGIFRESERNLLKIPGIGSQLARNIRNQNVLERAEKEIEFLEKNNIRSFFYLDPEYPERLKQCPDAPVIFYFLGNIDLNHPKIISVVGTRSATQRGRDLCKRLISDLSDRNHDPVIVSGLAYGIDICAHKSALQYGLNTIAVLGHGLSTIYPSIHKPVAREITRHGGLLTDFLNDEKPERNNFVKRNRLIAGLSDATIVIESGITGGALITADIANSYNRDVFAFPGRVKDTYSAGCNRIIKTNKAALIEGIRDIEYIMGWEPEPIKKGPVQKEMFRDLSEEEKVFMKMLKENDRLTINQMSALSGIPVSKASPVLLNLEFSGLVRCLPGNIYTLTS